MTWRISAAHEVGHGVAALVLGGDVGLICVRRGHPRFSGSMYWSGTTDPHIAAQVALSGLLCEARYAERPPNFQTGAADFDNALSSADHAVPESMRADWIADRATEADRLLDANWDAVLQAVRELMRRPASGTMSGRRLREIVGGHKRPAPSRTGGGFQVTPWPIPGRKRPRRIAGPGLEIRTFPASVRVDA